MDYSETVDDENEEEGSLLYDSGYGVYVRCCGLECKLEGKGFVTLARLAGSAARLLVAASF